jgi:hypothetical protein
MRGRCILLLITALVVALAVAPAAGAKKKHHRVRLPLTCDQTIAEVGLVAERYRTQYNAMGWTIESGPEGVLIAEGCANVGPLTRQGKFYMADFRHSDSDPPFPGETNPDVGAYRWYADVIVRRTKKGGLSDTVQNFTCVKDIGNRSTGDVSQVPC